ARRLPIEDISDQERRPELFRAEFPAPLQGLDRVEEFDHFLVGAIAQCAEKSCGEEFTAAFPAIEMDVEQIARIKLHFDPGTAIGNNAETVKNLAVEMDARFEGDPGRTMQLADDDTLRSVDDK